MVNYKLVKHCLFCKSRFVVEKKDARTNCCKACQRKLNKKDKK